MKFLHRLKISLKILAIAFTDELRTIGGDSGAMLLLVGAMIIYPIVYSVAYEKQNVTQIPISVVDNDHSPESRKLIQLLGAAPALFVQQEDASFSAAKLAFRNGNVKGIVVIPSNFAKQLFQNQQTKIPVYCDASYFLLYKETLSGVLGATSFMGAQTEAQKLLLKGKSRAQAAAITEIMPLQINTLFNPASGYGTFVMPGMILIILQQTLLVGIGLVGGAGREDTNNQLIEPGMRLRDGIFSLVLGKSFAYVAIYTFNYILTMGWIYRYFQFPEKGNFAESLYIVIPYFFAITFLGLAISLLFRKREYSIMFMVFISPIALFLSGVSWPKEAMPQLLWQVAHILPSTNFVPAYLRMRIGGANLAQIRTEHIFLLAQTIIYYFVAVLAFRLHSYKRSRI